MSVLTEAASRALPQPVRQRRPALAALAVLLVLGGALATTSLVLRADERVSVIRVTQRIGAGHPFGSGALQEARVADDGGSYWSWSQRDEVAAAVATVAVLPGTLLTGPMAAVGGNGAAEGKPVEVGLALKPGQAPYDLRRGEHVQLIHVSGRRSSPEEATVVVEDALVESVTYSAGSAGLATVVVDGVVAPTVASYAVNGEIAVAVVRAQG
ncbi:hypothetical protein HD597_012349 [Nonomuraea thailandensis]|uniref:SAF domain-containing protein n=1 Tax=Nonomuraea thailandensis TaxID=1188745 RepID=A0A9X2GX17_9ACTN|nr:hypothetical protein [Nonomuraea thailandensis]MCP2365329.1 hypothetical protein [Nonomuraea thailandensis]